MTPGAGGIPRWIVLGYLVATFAWAVIIVVSFTEPPTTPLGAAFVGGLVVFGVTLLLVLLDAVAPVFVLGPGLARTTLLIAASLVLWAPTQAWAEPGRLPWAWLAGFAIAACALASWQGGAVALLVLGGAAVVGAAVFDVALAPSLVTTLGCALTAWAMCQAPVWIHRLWWMAQVGQETRADLAVAEERLRVSRDLHDVLGRRLTVIALKAELAADLAARHPDRAAAESTSIRDLADGALREARHAIQGQTAAGLPAQLRSAELVLRSAGISPTIEADPTTLSQVPAPHAALLATVVREAVTNILRHSQARAVSIRIGVAASGVTLSVVNDGVGRSRITMSSAGTGLAALSARCSAVGATLVVDRDGDDRYELRLEAPRRGGGMS